jgi:hypothetical protein
LRNGAHFGTTKPEESVELPIDKNTELSCDWTAYLEGLVFAYYFRNCPRSTWGLSGNLGVQSFLKHPKDT